MISDDQHSSLHFAAQEACQSLKMHEYHSLNQRARVAMVQLAIHAGVTNVPWWPEWVGREEALAQAARPDFMEHSRVDVPADNEIELRQDDLRIERWPGSVDGPYNAVRILHIPSQNVVESSERVSFEENRHRAMEKLRARLADERDGLCPICHCKLNSGPCQRSHP
jgi:hypothetical protein